MPLSHQKAPPSVRKAFREAVSSLLNAVCSAHTFTIARWTRPARACGRSEATWGCGGEPDGAGAAATVGPAALPAGAAATGPPMTADPALAPEDAAPAGGGWFPAPAPDGAAG